MGRDRLTEPSCTWRLPDGRLAKLTHEGIVGRARSAQLVIDDGRVSSAHAELSAREGGWTLIARGGRLFVHGRPVARVVVREGLEVELAPGLVIAAVRVPSCGPAVPDTDGRRPRRWVIGPRGVVVFGPELPEAGLAVAGLGGLLLGACLRSGMAGAPWERVAAEVWPEDGALRAAGESWTEPDERRFRNRFDQHLRLLRRQIAHIPSPPDIEVSGGNVRVLLCEAEQIELEP